MTTIVLTIVAAALTGYILGIIIVIPFLPATYQIGRLLGERWWGDGA